MSIPIKTNTLRASAGWDGNKVVNLWFPYLDVDGEIILPHRYSSFLSTLTGRGKKRGKTVRPEARHHLLKYLGLKPKEVDLFLSRRISEIERTEEELKALVDNLLLFDVECFKQTAENKKFLIHLLRQVIKTSTYSVDTVTKQYKQFANYIWMEKTKSETIEKPVIGRYNIFRPLVTHPCVKRLDVSDGNQRGLSSLAHLITTRNFVSGGKKVMLEALKKFENTTSVEFNSTDYVHPHLSGFAVGRKVKKWIKSFPDSAAHVSLNSAGSFDSPSKDGGRFIEINNDLRLILNHIPKENGEISLPLGFKAKELAGVERWKTWARETPITAEAEFGAKIEKLEDLYEEIRFWGLDEHLGHQLYMVGLYVAYISGYIDMEGNVLQPIPARTLTVPEPGGKSRVVTTSLWWVIILQQPGGHMLKELLKLHPSAESGMERTDQAWNYIPLIRKVTDIDLSQYQLLSSDLEEATDALDPRVVYDQVTGFMGGIGSSDPLISLGLKLVTSQRLIFTEGSTFIKKRGILMGEPMTKALLCLYNLCVEEKAIREYLFRDTHEFPDRPDLWSESEWYTRPVQVTWRAYHVGGDDHLALGPPDYLKKITETHIVWGSKISKTKHAQSSLAVRYCEKVLVLKNKNHRLSEWDINSSTDNYLNSVWVDSVKVRLLSPISKSIEVQNDHNIAIGKAISLGRTLRWLNTDLFPRKWVEMVRARFFRRMKAYLPKEGSSLYYQVLLPQKLGGLDLFLNGELPEIFKGLPRPTKQYIERLLKGEANEIEKWQMSTFVTSDIERGINTNESLLTAIQRDAKWVLISRGFGIESLPIKEARDKLSLPAGNMRGLVKSLRNEGWMTFDAILKMRQRPRLFQEMVLNRADTSQKYGTMSWKKRYAFIWDLLDRGDTPLDQVFLDEALKGLEKIELYMPLMVYNVQEETDGPFVHPDGKITIEDAPFETECIRMLPNLSLEGISNQRA